MFLFFVDQILSFWWYCWWKKSCTSWDVKFLVNNGINYLSTSAGFLPPTVVSNKPSQATRRCWYSVNPPIQAAQILQEQGRKSKPISQLLGVKFWSPWGFGSGANGAETLIVFLIYQVCVCKLRNIVTWPFFIVEVKWFDIPRSWKQVSDVCLFVCLFVCLLACLFLWQCTIHITWSSISWQHMQYLEI